VRAVRVAGEREEVVPGPDGIGAKSVGAQPRPLVVGEGGVLGADLHPDLDLRHGVLPVHTVADTLTTRSYLVLVSSHRR
jgi:hypothetical protein